METRYLIVPVEDVDATRAAHDVVPGTPRLSVDGSQAVLRVRPTTEGDYPDGALTHGAVLVLMTDPEWHRPDPDEV